MTTRKTMILATLAYALVAAAGCSPQFAVTTELARPVDQPTTFRVGPIEDALPATLPPEDKPSIEDIEKFKEFLVEEIENRDLDFAIEEGAGCRYEITGAILDYKKGSGFLRFLIGFGAGSSKVVTEVKLVDLETGKVVFGGNFDGKVADWTSKGSAMFKNVARNFSKELEKQQDGLKDGPRGEADHDL